MQLSAFPGPKGDALGVGSTGNASTTSPPQIAKNAGHTMQALSSHDDICSSGQPEAAGSVMI